MQVSEGNNALLRRKEELLRRVKREQRKGLRWFSSPARAEIVGNHTDHNHGKAVVSALSCDVLGCASENGGDLVEIVSEGYRPIRVSLSDLAPRPEEQGRSAALVRGVLEYLRGIGPLRGFTATTSSTVFKGAGVSSSAAFAVLVAEIENAFAFHGTLSPLQKAKAAQYAENAHFNKPCGLLDQCAVAYGGLNKIDFLDPSVPAVDPLPALSGYSIVLTNTGGSHTALVSHYAAIKREMGDVAAFFGKQYLREVEREELFEALPRIRKRVSERAILRAVHFFEENDRVDRAARALREQNADSFLEQVAKSGESSLTLLQNCFVPGSVSQPLVLALKVSEKLLRGGAYRMMGGGFTGAVIAFVPQGEEERYTGGMARVFGGDNVYLTSVRAAGAKEIRP